jgi:hypothetical protein
MDSEEKSWDAAVLIVAPARSTRDLATMLCYFTI